MGCSTPSASEGLRDLQVPRIVLALEMKPYGEPDVQAARKPEDCTRRSGPWTANAPRRDGHRSRYGGMGPRWRSWSIPPKAQDALRSYISSGRWLGIPACIK